MNDPQLAVPLSIDHMRDIETRILAHKNDPTKPAVPREELRAALDTIRGQANSRSSNSPTAAKAKVSLPTNLVDLFKQ